MTDHQPLYCEWAGRQGTCLHKVLFHQMTFRARSRTHLAPVLSVSTTLSALLLVLKSNANSTPTLCWTKLFPVCQEWERGLQIVGLLFIFCFNRQSSSMGQWVRILHDTAFTVTICCLPNS